MVRFLKLPTLFLFVLLVAGRAEAQIPISRYRRDMARPTPPLRRATDLIHRQEPINVSPRLLAQLTPDNSHVHVSLTKQRAYLMLGDEVVVDSPISSGKRARPTPTGNFHVLEKDKEHHSSDLWRFLRQRGARR